MENSNNSQSLVKDDAFWLNEISYFETAQDALKKCYSIISSLREHALEQLQHTAPQREEVVVE